MYEVGLWYMGSECAGPGFVLADQRQAEAQL